MERCQMCNTPIFGVIFTFFALKKRKQLKTQPTDAKNSNFISEAERDLSLPYSMIWKCKTVILWNINGQPPNIKISQIK